VRSDSDSSYNGDVVNVVYLRTKPYVSRPGVKEPDSLRVTQVFCAFWLDIFLLGLWLCGIFPRKGRILDIEPYESKLLF
jgi:hypothetical protein